MQYRTPPNRPRHKTYPVALREEEYDFIVAEEADEGEAMWRTVRRLIRELTALRAKQA